MKYIRFFLVHCILLYSTACFGQQDNSGLSGEYLGQKPPGDLPEVFAPGIISLGFHELSVTFSPDGDEIFYIMSDKEYSHYVIVRAARNKNIWSPPEIAHFSGIYSNYSIQFAPGGDRLFFTSKRPSEGETAERDDHDIWTVEKQGKEWGSPVHLSNPVNSGSSESSVSVSSSGNLYFSRERDIYISRYTDGRYGDPKQLSDNINKDKNVSRPFIAPDESYLLFQSNLEEGFGGNDIYVSFRNNDKTWGIPVNLGETVNSDASDFGPSVTPDGKYLFFSSYRSLPPSGYMGKSYKELLRLYRSPQSGYSTLYWINAGIINELRNKQSR